jgi:hypothetical protein
MTDDWSDQLQPVFVAIRAYEHRETALPAELHE